MTKWKCILWSNSFSCFEMLQVGAVLFVLSSTVCIDKSCQNCQCAKELLTDSLTPVCPLLLFLCYPIFLLLLLLLPHWPLNYTPHPPPISSFYSSSSPLLSSPAGGCQGPAGGRATGSGTQPGPVWHHGPTEAGWDQGADPPRDPQGAEDQRGCREPAQGNIAVTHKRDQNQSSRG